jgi:DNA polymerase-3 subunit gamma/tau
MDVLEIDGASNRGIDEVRELRENIKYLPAQGHYKVFIIDEVHMLTKEAFNALLKTLEEPPKHAIFIMATTEPHKVPLTILSRCQRYDFQRIPASFIQDHLANLAAQEGWRLEPEGLQLIARESEGGMRDAQGLLDQVITFGGTQVSTSEIARILGVTDRALLLQALSAIISRQGAELLQLVEELHNHGLDHRRFYQDLLFFSRHLLIASFGPEARHLVEVAEQEWEQLVNLAQQVKQPHLYNLLTVLLKGEEELRRSALPRLTLEILLLRVAHLEPLIELSEWLERLRALESRLAAGPDVWAEARPEVGGTPALPTAAFRLSPPPPSVPAPAVATPSVVAPPLEAPPEVTVRVPPGDGNPSERWPDFLKFIKTRTEVPFYSKLQQSRVIKAEDNRLMVEAGKSWKTASSAQQSQLRELAQEFFGPQCELVLEIAADKPRTRPRSQKSMDEIKQQTLEIFGGYWLVESPVPPAAKEEGSA